MRTVTLALALGAATALALMDGTARADVPPTAEERLERAIKDEMTGSDTSAVIPNAYKTCADVYGFGTPIKGTPAEKCNTLAAWLIRTQALNADIRNLKAKLAQANRRTCQPAGYTRSEMACRPTVDGRFVCETR